MLILKAVSLGPLHGYGVLLRIQQISGQQLEIQQGSLSIRTRPTHTIVSPMRTWRPRRKIWHGRPPKRRWPCWIPMRRRRRHGPIPRSVANSFATVRKPISSIDAPRVNSGIPDVTHRHNSRQHTLPQQIECYEPEPGFAEIWAVAAFNAATFPPLPTFSPEWCPSRIITRGYSRGGLEGLCIGCRKHVQVHVLPRASSERLAYRASEPAISSQESGKVTQLRRRLRCGGGALSSRDTCEQSNDAVSAVSRHQFREYAESVRP